MKSSPSPNRILGGPLRIVPGEPSLILEHDEDRILVASDLHIGFEKELASKGINIPSQTPKLLAKLKKIVKQHQVNKIIFLGDVKHGTSKILLHEWSDVPEVFEGLSKFVDRIEIVLGNHDGGLRHLLPPDVIVHPPQGIILKIRGKRIAMIHGHAWPSPETFSADCLLMGHHHFTFEFRDPSGLRFVEPVWLTTTWNAKAALPTYLESKGIKAKDSSTVEHLQTQSSMDLIVLPAFNPLLGGFPVNAEPPGEYLGPVFTSGSVDMDHAELFLLDGTFLGRLKDLGRFD